MADPAAKKASFVLRDYPVWEIGMESATMGVACVRHEAARQDAGYGALVMFQHIPADHRLQIHSKGPGFWKAEAVYRVSSPLTEH